MLSNCGAGKDSWKSLRSKGIKSVNRERNQPWIFIAKTDADAEAPIFWPSAMKRQLTGKDLDAWKDWGQEEKGVTVYEIVGWHHWLIGHEFKQTQRDTGGQESLACYSSWGHKESNMTWQLNNNNNIGKWGKCLKIMYVYIRQRTWFQTLWKSLINNTNQISKIYTKDWIDNLTKKMYK